MPGTLMLLLARLVFALYLLSSALSVFDRHPLAAWEVGLRLLLAVLLLSSLAALWIGAAVAAVALLIIHARSGKALATA